MTFAEMMQIVRMYRHAKHAAKDGEASDFRVAMSRQLFLETVKVWPQLQYGNADKNPENNVRLIVAPDVIEATANDMITRQSLLIDGRFVPVVFTDED